MIVQGKGLLTDLCKQRRIDRLHDVMPGAQAERLFTNPSILLSGHHHNRHMRMLNPEVPEHLNAVHDGHLQVQQHAPDRSLLRLERQERQPRPSVVSDNDGIAHGFKSVSQAFTDMGLVINDQKSSSHVTLQPEPEAASPSPGYR